MIFSSIEIKNFRSINNDGIKINFGKELDFYSLIGANNSGKSNILDALALVLGVSYRHRNHLKTQKPTP